MMNRVGARPGLWAWSLQAVAIGLCWLASVAAVHLAATDASAQPLPPTRPPVADVTTLAAQPMLDDQHLIVTVPITSTREAERRSATLAEEFPVEPVTLWPLLSVDLHCLIVRVEDGASVDAVIEAIGNEPDVATVAVVRPFSLQEEPGMHARQLAPRAMNVDAAHGVATGQSVRVALIDTGIDADHPDLAAAIEGRRDFVVDGGGADIAEDHATAVAGVIVADGRPHSGLLGVAPSARVLSLRACWERDGRGMCTSFSLARALNVAIVQGVDVINLSLGGPFDPLLERLVAAAMEEGIVVVGAHGSDAFPGEIAGVIVATRSASEAAQLVPAPGTDILTTVPGGGYGFRSGGSISAGHVSGVVALVLERYPQVTADAFSDLFLSAKRSTDTPFGPTLDACRALFAAGASELSCPP